MESLCSKAQNVTVVVTFRGVRSAQNPAPVLVTVLVKIQQENATVLLQQHKVSTLEARAPNARMVTSETTANAETSPSLRSFEQRRSPQQEIFLLAFPFCGQTQTRRICLLEVVLPSSASLRLQQETLKNSAASLTLPPSTARARTWLQRLKSRFLGLTRESFTRFFNLAVMHHCAFTKFLKRHSMRQVQQPKQHNGFPTARGLFHSSTPLSSSVTQS
jgi:hypothetical protein